MISFLIALIAAMNFLNPVLIVL